MDASIAAALAALASALLLLFPSRRSSGIPPRSVAKARSRETNIGGYIWNRVCESHGHKLLKGSHTDYRNNRYVIQLLFLAKNTDHGSLGMSVEVKSISGSKEAEIRIYGAAGAFDERTLDQVEAVGVIQRCLEQVAR